MRQVNIHEAKTKLSELIAAVEAGEEVAIARAGKRVARLVPIDRSEANERPILRQGGSMKGEFIIPADHDDAALDAEIAADFEASIQSPIEGRQDTAKSA